MWTALQHIRAVTGKELRHLARDRLTFGMIVGIPLLQILLFGYAIDTDVRHLRAGVTDLANTTLSRVVVQNAEATQIIDPVAAYADDVALKAALDRGEIDVGIYIPPDMERRLQDGRPGAQLLIDGADPTVERVIRQLERLPPGMRPQVEERQAGLFASRTWYNPEQRSQVNIVPALIGVILNLSMVLFTAVAIVRERERGNLEFLITTPIGSAELMAGKLIPYVFIGLVQAALILVVGAWLFDVPINGSLVDLFIASLVFIAATLTLGILISTLAQSQFQAMQLTVFTYLPSILLSGFMFPFEGMPRAAQWLAELLPLTHFLRLVRGIILRGAELNLMMTEIYALFAFFAVTLMLAILRFRKRLD